MKQRVLVSLLIVVAFAASACGTSGGNDGNAVETEIGEPVEAPDITTDTAPDTDADTEEEPEAETSDLDAELPVSGRYGVLDIELTEATVSNAWSDGEPAPEGELYLNVKGNMTNPVETSFKGSRNMVLLTSNGLVPTGEGSFEVPALGSTDLDYWFTIDEDTDLSDLTIEWTDGEDQPLVLPLTGGQPEVSDEVAIDLAGQTTGYEDWVRIEATGGATMSLNAVAADEQILSETYYSTNALGRVEADHFLLHIPMEIEESGDCPLCQLQINGVTGGVRYDTKAFVDGKETASYIETDGSWGNNTVNGYLTVVVPIEAQSLEVQVVGGDSEGHLAPIDYTIDVSQASDLIAA